MLKSLRSRLIVLLALALLPASTLAIIQAITSYEQVKGLTERSLLQSSAVLVSKEKNEIAAARDELEKLAALPAVNGFVPGGCGQALMRLRSQSNGRYENLMALRQDGTVACSTNLDQASGFGSTEWFIRTVANESFTVTGKVRLSDSQEEPALLASLPLRAPSAELVGVIAMTVRHAWLKDLLRLESGEPLANTSVALLDRRGDVMAESAVGAESGQWMPAAFVIGARLSGRAQTFATEGRDGVQRIYALTPLYEQQVYIVLGGVSGHLLAGPSLQLIAGLAYPLLMWLIAIGVAWFAVDHLVLRPILRLRRTANAYAEGHFEVRTAGIDDSPQEIRDLGSTMHKMADVISLHESELRKSLQEQKTLLREVYHRVKNNLQVVSSLVNLQVSRAGNAHERNALRTTQDRIHALSMVHSNLYEAPELHRIKLEDFVPQLCEYLRHAQGARAENIEMQFDIDPLWSEPDRAVPLALLITEVVTNALKQGWPTGEPGLLSISLKQERNGTLVMTISDNGSTTESASSESLGGRLIHAFAKQLGGEVRITSDNTGFRLVLRLPQL